MIQNLTPLQYFRHSKLKLMLLLRDLTVESHVVSF